MSRRRFLASAAALGSGWILSRGAPAADNSAAPGTDLRADGAPSRLVVIFLRGAVDGLSVVVPYSDPEYYSVRPRIALPRPGRDGGVLDLDGRFGLHPALGALLPLWSDGRLAFVHASGSPDPTRSHFDAQDFMESGTPGRTGTADGWMNRLLGALPGPASAAGAVNVGEVVPRILRGARPVASLASGRAAVRRTAIDRAPVRGMFDRLYEGDDPVSRAYRDGLAARGELMQELEAEQQQADNGAAPAAALGADAARVGALIRRDPAIRLAFLAAGGWDTHANQGAAAGQLAARLKPLGEGVASLARSLGPALEHTVIVVMSEFGRTVHENGNAGTDHGHGNVMWLIGGGIRGGKVHGEWPGLARGALYEGRDLAVLTDFRDPLALVAERHLGLGDAALAGLFPGGLRRDPGLRRLIA